MLVAYAIDAADRLIEVNQAWGDFARANDAADLAEPPLGQLLWESIDDDDLAAVWRLILGRARRSLEPSVMPFRCDSPDRRRWFDMTLIAAPDESVTFRSQLRREEGRSPVALLDRRTARDPDAPLLAVCSWCASVQDGETWVAVDQFVRERGLMEQTDMPGLTHGICPICAAQLVVD